MALKSILVYFGELQLQDNKVYSGGFRGGSLGSDKPPFLQSF